MCDCACLSAEGLVVAVHGSCKQLLRPAPKQILGHEPPGSMFAPSWKAAVCLHVPHHPPHDIDTPGQRPTCSECNSERLLASASCASHAATSAASPARLSRTTCDMCTCD